MTAPVRLQLSRRNGFDLQAHSLATNGLPAVNVARPGGFGNPFTVAGARETGYRGTDEDLAARCVEAFRVWIDTLMRMQNSYDIAQARKREGEINVAPFKGKPLDPQAALI